MVRYNERQFFYMQAFDYLKANGIKGHYHEYGCHKGITFRMALTEARRKNIKPGEMQFYAFDSFEGLPDISDEDSNAFGWKQGALKTNIESFTNLIKDHGLYVDSVHCIKGFYHKTLTTKLQKELAKQGPIALAVIDCDLYESAKVVLSFIEPLLQVGTLLYFDDYFNYKGDPSKGEQRAFNEFKKRSDLAFLEHMTVGWFGKSFITYKP